MQSFAPFAVAVSVAVVAVTGASSQSQPSAATDVYHVHFTKAAPGDAAALGKALMAPVPGSPMPDHFLLLRHQEGDDWDYAVIQHLGPKAAVTATPPPPGAERDLRAWHTDTFVSGPSWGDFSREMALGGSANTASLVYVVGVHRAAPGHRDQLEKLLHQPAAPGSKIQTGTAFFQHLEGGNWNFLTLTRYNSWQDFAAERAEAARAGAGAADGWADLRAHSAFHRDTIADRLFPK